MPPTDTDKTLARRLGLFDATMIVMGGIIGSGIFMNPSVVAREVNTPFLVLGAWIVGGLFALAAAFIWAELAERRPDVGGQYVYLREAFHPAIGFLYGWVLLLVVQTGGMAAVAVTFARYFVELVERSTQPLTDRGARIDHSDGNQLSRCARRQQRAERVDGLENTGDCRARGLWIFIRRPGRQHFAVVGPARVARFADGIWRRTGTGDF